MRKKPSVVPLYPLLLAVHYPLYLMASDLGMTDLQATARPAIAGFLVALLLMGLFGALLRDIYRGALCAALIVILVYHFDRLEMFFNRTIGRLAGPLPDVLLLAALLVLAIAIVTLARPGPNLTRIANVMAGVMLALPLATLLWQEAEADDAMAHTLAAERRDRLLAAARPAGSLPNIVHVVLDGYARQDVLADLYGFDNTPFLDGLRRLDFAVADKATTPYNQTMLVMTSVLSADYLDPQAPLPPGMSLRRSLRHQLQANPVMANLSRLGYQTAAIDVRYDPIRMERVDRLLGRRWISNFGMTTLERSLLHRLALRLGFVEASLPPDMFETPYERELASPFFLYVHALAPHPPFDVNRHGEPVEPEGGWRGLADGSHFTDGNPQRRRIYRDGYVEKLRFTNQLVVAYLTRLVQEVPDPKVILVHGDYGGGLLFDQGSLEHSCAAERFSPLLAVYASDGRLQRAIPPDLNLANLYRLVFNTYLGTQLPLLAAQSTFADWLEPTRQQPVSPGQLQQRCVP